MNYNSLVESLDLEKITLDKASMQQPVLYEAVVDNVSESWKVFQTTKLEMEILKSQTELRIRKEKEVAGEKTTEGKISALIDVDPDYIDKRVNLIEAENTYQKWSNLKRSMEMRGESIRILATCFKDAMAAYTN